MSCAGLMGWMSRREACELWLPVRVFSMSSGWWFILEEDWRSLHPTPPSLVRSNLQRTKEKIYVNPMRESYKHPHQREIQSNWATGLCHKTFMFGQEKMSKYNKKQHLYSILLSSCFRKECHWVRKQTYSRKRWRQGIKHNTRVFPGTYSQLLGHTSK